MNANIEQEEIKPLIFNYIFHCFLFILIFILHIIIGIKIYWVLNIFYQIYLFGTYFGIFYFVFPLVPMMFIFLKHFTKKVITYFKKLTLYILILSILIGILNSAIILINTLNSKVFCKECPFSISSLSHLNHIFASYYGKIPINDELNDLCKSRRCTLDSENQNDEYPYIYLCNYNPTDDFIEEEEDITYTRTMQNLTVISTDSQLICTAVGRNYENDINFIHSELYDYIGVCYYLTEFYYCKRFNEPEKTYKMDLDSSCPEENYIFLLYVLSILIIIIDVVISMLPWGVEYISLKRVIVILGNARRKPTSHNSTAKDSAPSNNEESFKKERTLIIISPLTDDNNNNINNINNNNNDINNNNNNINKNNRNSNNPLIMINNDENGNNEQLKSSERPLVNQIYLGNNDNNQNIIIVHNRNIKTNQINESTDFHGSLLVNNNNVRDRIIESNENKNNNDKKSNNNNNNNN